MTTIASDVSCLIGADLNEIGEQVMGAPVVPPLEWFTSPPAGVDLREMAWVDLCSEPGRFFTVMGEEGVPFTTPYADISAPIAAGADSYYMQSRSENLMQMLDGSGNVVEMAAGPIGFGHSPDTILFEDELYQWHDRKWASVSMERALVRARLGVTDGVVWAAGALDPTATWLEAVSVSRSEISPEFMLIEENGRERLEYVTASLVYQGNTRTSASSPARASVRDTVRIVGENARVHDLRPATFKESRPEYYNERGEYVGAMFKKLAGMGIAPELAEPGDRVCSVGYCEADGKWYGWSHRAIHGYGTREEAVAFAREVASLRGKAKPMALEMEMTLDLSEARAEVAALKAEIEELQKVRKACGDTPCAPCAQKAAEAAATADPEIDVGEQVAALEERVAAAEAARDEALAALAERELAEHLAVADAVEIDMEPLGA